MNRYEKEIDTLRAFLEIHETPDCVRKALMRRITDLDHWALDHELTRNAGKRWTEDDEKIVFDALDGWTAKTYRDSDDKYDEIAYKLRRPVATVKKKLKAGGFSALFDAWYHHD